MPENGLSVALWSTHLGQPLGGLDDWVAGVDAQLQRCAQRGVELLLMPEWMSAQWLGFAPALKATQEVPWMAQHSTPALAAVSELCTRYGVGLVAGSLPVATDDSDSTYVNRAHLLLPEGQPLVHDKLCLTPDERDPQGWLVRPGTQVSVLNWRGWRIAMLICLDVELPALAARLVSLDLDLLLVPSMTQRLSGYQRVLNCARARAVELQTAVCVVGCIGAPRPGWKPFVGGGAAFLPCEPGLGQTGVHTELLPAVNAEGAGPVVIARDLPLAAIRQHRHGGAEVWPGDWDASQVHFHEIRP